jgi:hypothetical protein
MRTLVHNNEGVLRLKGFWPPVPLPLNRDDALLWNYPLVWGLGTIFGYLREGTVAS